MRRESRIKREKLWKLLGYQPHSTAQRAFHESPARFRIPICGRRFGKSTMAAVDLIEACFIPDSIYWICGPTYQLAEKEFRPVWNAFMDPRKLDMSEQIKKKAYNAKQGDMRIEFPWGTQLICVSATNEDSLLGEGLDGVIMSEAARHSMRTWEQYVEPALSDKLGWATFPTTPRGFNWIHGMHMLGLDPSMPDYDTWQYPTWLNTYRYPHDVQPDEEGVANSELQRIKSIVSTGYWKQEYGAQFTTFEGQIYEEFDPTIHVRDISYQSMWANYIVFDYGFSAPFVCLDIMVDPSDNVYVWREYQLAGKTTWEHATFIRDRENPPGYRVDGMFGDPRGGDEGATIALVLGPVVARPVPWEQGIEAVKRHLKPGSDGLPKLFIDRSCHDLIRQIQGLRKKDQKDGKNPTEGQHDYDDHGPDALRYFFNEYFVLGAAGSLASVYGTSQLGSESESFFSSRMQIKLTENIGF